MQCIDYYHRGSDVGIADMRVVREYPGYYHYVRGIDTYTGSDCCGRFSFTVECALAQVDRALVLVDRTS